MNGTDWKVWRPAIWLAMLGVLIMLAVSPWYLGAVFIGGAIGVAIRIRQRLAAQAKSAPPPGRQRRRR